MKVLFAAACAAVLVSAAPAIASAQTATANTGVYGTLGYGNARYEGSDLGAMQGRLGYRFTERLGVEGELAGGVKSDKFGAAGVSGKAKLRHQEAIYGVGFLPVASNLEVLGRVGYGHAKIKAYDLKVNGVPANVKVSGSGDSWNYGVGGLYHWDAQNGVRADYTRHEFQGSSGGHADVWAIAYNRKF